MIGMNTYNGKEIHGQEHLQQSIRDILMTPIGSRLMLPEYGSELPRLIDQPLNQSTLVDIYSAVAIALKRWEPRFSLSRVQASRQTPGQITLDLDGTHLTDGQPLHIREVFTR